jgi:hypothetical protein
VRVPQNSIVSEEDQGVIVRLNEGDKTYWKQAENSDIAIIKAPIDLFQSYWDLNAVYINDFGSPQDIFQGASVLTLGYPRIPGPEYLHTPIERRGIIAWLDPVDGVNKPFLIDSNIVHGNSGGHVFRIRTGISRSGALNLTPGLAFIGIVSKNAFEEAPVHVGQDPALRINPATGQVERYSATVENIGCIGIVEPVTIATKLVREECHP